jgi:hypothetical protein
MLAEEHVHLRISSLFRHGLQADGVRAATDLHGVSEVWPAKGSCAPAWYVWLTTCAGAYELRLHEAESVMIDGMTLDRGLLTLRYFPSPTEPVFSLLAPAQRDLVASPLFDATHTPRFGCADRVPADWFTIGTIEVLQSAAADASLLMLACGDPYGTCITGSLPSAEQGPLPLPFWQLGYPVFDTMIGLTSYLLRRGPARVVCGRRLAAGAEPRLKTAVVGFFEGARSDVAVACDHLEAALGHDPWQTTCRFPVRHAREPSCRRSERDAHAPCHDHHDPGHHEHGHDSAVPIPLRCNEAWWTLASADARLIALPCGCH